jgi:uncharacterized protein YciI
MQELPEDVSIETIYLVEVPYTPEAPQRRPAHRLEHLTRIARLIREGTIVEAGGCADFSKAVLLVRVAVAADALRIIDEDVYTREGIWHAPTACAYGRVVVAERAPAPA